MKNIRIVPATIHFMYWEEENSDGKIIKRQYTRRETDTMIHWEDSHNPNSNWVVTIFKDSVEPTGFCKELEDAFHNNLIK